MKSFQFLTCEHRHSLDGSGPGLAQFKQQSHSVAETMKRRVEQQRLAGVHKLNQDQLRFSGDLSRVRRDVLSQVRALERRYDQTVIIYGRLERQDTLKREETSRNIKKQRNVKIIYIIRKGLK